MRSGTREAWGWGIFPDAEGVKATKEKEKE